MSNHNHKDSKDNNKDHDKKSNPNPMVQKYWLELNKNDNIAYSIFNISKDDIINEITVEDDLELLNFALESIEYETGKLEWVVGKSDYKPPPINSSSTVVVSSPPPTSSSSSSSSSSSNTNSHSSSSHDKDKNVKERDPDSVMFLSKLPDGVFVSGATSMALNRHRADFSLYGNGIFNVLRNEFLDETVLNTMKEPTDLPPPVKYSEDKLSLLFIDSLTYPRPVRKFKMLFGKTSLMGFLRDMMISEVGLEDRDALVLLTKGKPIPQSYDVMSLEAIGIKSGQKIIVSRKLGVPQEPYNGMTERNRQFVGDLLFGPAGDNKSNTSGQSISKTFKTSHGYQILGRTIERLLMVRFSEAYRKEEGARKSEEELYALLEEEDREKEAEEAKKKKKKEKEKEKKKKEQQEKKELAAMEQKKNSKNSNNNSDSKNKGKGKDVREKEKEEKDDGSSSDEDAWITGIRRGGTTLEKPPLQVKTAAATQSDKSRSTIISGALLTEEQQIQAALKLSLAEAKQNEEEVVVTKGRQKKKKKDEIPINNTVVKPVQPIKPAPPPQFSVQRKPTVPPPVPVTQNKDLKTISAPTPALAPVTQVRNGEKPKYSQVTIQSVNSNAVKKQVANSNPIDSNSQSTSNARINLSESNSSSDVMKDMSSLRLSSDTTDIKNNDLSYLNAFFPSNTNNGSFAQSISLIDNFLGTPASSEKKASIPLPMAPPGLGLVPNVPQPVLSQPSVQPAVNFCPSCGSKLQQSHRFCWNCGSDIKVSVVASDPITAHGSSMSGILSDSSLYKQPVTGSAFSNTSGIAPITASAFSNVPSIPPITTSAFSNSSTTAPMGSAFSNTWGLPIPPTSSQPIQQPISVPGPLKSDLNAFSKDASDSDILALNSILTFAADAPPFIPASMKVQSQSQQSNTNLGSIGMQSKNTNNWEDPNSYGNVNMLMSFLGDDEGPNLPTDQQRPRQDAPGTSRLGIFNKGGYI